MRISDWSSDVCSSDLRLGFETDCWDVHASISAGEPDFVLLDVRTPALYAKGHVPGALNLPHREITEGRLRGFPPDTLFVVYCAGPHCNGANNAALRIARRSEERRVGTEGVSTCSSWWAPDP